MDSTTIKPAEPESRALGMAIAVGLEPRMAYTIPQTSRYSGIPVTEMDRYMEVHGDE